MLQTTTEGFGQDDYVPFVATPVPAVAFVGVTAPSDVSDFESVSSDLGDDPPFCSADVDLVVAPSVVAVPAPAEFSTPSVDVSRPLRLR